MKVLVLPDARDWSCDFTSDYIIKYLPEIEFTKRYVGELNNIPIVQKGDDFDVIWVMLHYLIKQVVEQIKDAGLLKKAKLLLGIRGAFGLKDAAKLDLTHIDGIGVQSKWAYQQLQENIPEYENVWVTYDGVDEKIFKPMPNLRPSPDRYIIGWAGQPRLWVKRFEKIKTICSGYETHFAECNAPEGVYAYQHHEMPAYYNSLSTFFHYSEQEGAPRPVIEAAACGLPVITSPTGYGQEVIDKDYHAIDDYHAMTYLNLLKNNPKLRNTIGERNRQEVLDKWTWELRAPGYDNFFRHAGDRRQ